MKHALFALASLLLPATALAQSTAEPPANAPPTAPTALSGEVAGAPAARGSETKDGRNEGAIVAYTYAAAGVSSKTIGVQAYGLGLVAQGQDGGVGGGGAVWGSPIDRLTIAADAQRNVTRDFSPSAAAIVRLYGNGAEGLTLGALGKFKIDGFGKGPSGNEVESELEIGGLLSLAAGGWHPPADAAAGRGGGAVRASGP